MEAVAIVSFTYTCDEETLSELAMDFATNVEPSVEGLIRKIYLNDPERQRSAGIYLFRSLQSANRYVNGLYVQGLRGVPFVSSVSTEVFQTMLAPTMRYGAPLLDNLAMSVP